MVRRTAEPLERPHALDLILGGHEVAARALYLFCTIRACFCRGVHHLFLSWCPVCSRPYIGERIWTRRYRRSPNWGPMLTTAGGLVFTGGTVDRNIHAFDAVSGKILWIFLGKSGEPGNEPPTRRLRVQGWMSGDVRPDRETVCPAAPAASGCRYGQMLLAIFAAPAAFGWTKSG